MKRHEWAVHQFLVIMLVSMLILTSMPPVDIIRENYTGSEMDHSSSFLVQPIVGDLLDRVSFEINNTHGSFDGYNLFLLEESNITSGDYSTVLLIIDMNGNVIAERDLGSIPIFNNPAEFIDPETVLIGTETGAAFWYPRNDTMDWLDIHGHHEYEYNPNNDTIFTLRYTPQQIDGVDYMFDTLCEYDLSGNLVWSWNVSDFISEEWWCPYKDMNNFFRIITHTNTIYYDADDDIIFLNVRNTNTFYKLNHTSKEVIWGLGEYGNFTLYDIHGDECEELFYHAHAVEPIDANTFILFDNDYHNQTYEYNEISRIVEIKINETTMTANESWFYEAPHEYYSAYWGDADRLPNNNRIGTWGYPSTPADDISASLIEVNSNREIVWQLDLPYQGDFQYGVYRMERFRFRPILNSPADIESVDLDNALSWDVWYDHRNKRELPGNYTLYIDGTPTQTGTFNYTKYWQPTTIELSTGILERGIHNVTLEVDDGFGYKASDGVNLTVGTYYISRTGPIIIEKGQTTGLPTWSGATIFELFYNVTLNATLFLESDWTGQDIVLDPTSIDLGVHLVHLKLFNGSEIVYEDIFWLHVEPTNPPVIVPDHTSLIEIFWNDPLTLSWILSDATPHSWWILVNEVQRSEGSWSEQNHHLIWQVPTYPEGTYNITLVARDVLGQTTKSETTLNVFLSSNPYILSGPENRTIAWGRMGVSFEWNTYNAETWSLLRNGTSIDDGDATSGNITHVITAWKEGGWWIGTYNMSLQVMNAGNSITQAFWLDIVADPGDPYADAVVTGRSESYLMGENAVGAPDGLLATIYVDYTDGYLTLDMGDGEEIVDGPSFDFTVYAKDTSEYKVSISNSFYGSFVTLDTGTGIQSFDLATSGFSEARYVRITHFLGADTELDAIVAINYNIFLTDSDPPHIEASTNVLSLENGTETSLLWIVTDEMPWSYEIYLNSTLEISEFWDGSDVEYLFQATSVGVWNVTLAAYDAFGNVGVHSVLVEVFLPTSPQTPFSIHLLAGGFFMGLGIVFVLFILIEKRTHRLVHHV